MRNFVDFVEMLKPAQRKPLKISMFSFTIFEEYWSFELTLFNLSLQQTKTSFHDHNVTENCSGNFWKIVRKSFVTKRNFNGVNDQHMELHLRRCFSGSFSTASYF